jgi:YhcH/YjgK/YiaL family protein
LEQIFISLSLKSTFMKHRCVSFTADSCSRRSATGFRLSAAPLASVLLLFVFSLASVSVTAQSAAPKSSKAAKKWMEHGAWRKGLHVKPSSSINATEFYTQYHKHKEWWDKAMAFLNRSDLGSLAPGTYPIVGKDVYASISEYVPKDIDKSQWESHRKYADIQAVIAGKEKIGKSSVSQLTVTRPYNPKSDGANYTGPGKYYIARPGTFFIFFPGDGHRPGLKTSPSDTAHVKKLVIKMHVTE